MKQKRKVPTYKPTLEMLQFLNTRRTEYFNYKRLKYRIAYSAYKIQIDYQLTDREIGKYYGFNAERLRQINQSCYHLHSYLLRQQITSIKIEYQ